MSEMLERVAAAICEEDTPGHNWAEIDPVWQEMNRRRARAAINAMREPTKAMLAASYVGAYEPGDLAPYEVWPKMIDAALKESEQVG